MHERSSLFDVTIQSILYLTGTDTRRCLPRHVTRAEWESVGYTNALDNSTTASPITFKFGVCLEAG